MFKEMIDNSMLHRDELQLLYQLAEKHESGVTFTAIVRDTLETNSFETLFSEALQARYAKAIDSIKANKQLHITEYCSAESGKMIGVPALGTTASACNSCIENIIRAIAAADLNCPCLHCYSQLGTHYNFDQAYLIINHDMLQRVLTDNELMPAVKVAVKVATKAHTINGVKYEATYQIRIQHKGDVDSAIEARNYARFAELVHIFYTEKSISVTAWTKFPETYDKAMKLFTDVDFSHLRIGYSAFKFGTEGIYEGMRIKKQFRFIKFVFVVYERDDGKTARSDEDNKAYVDQHFKPIVETLKAVCVACKCDKGSCGKCGACYGRGIINDLTFVFELKRTV